jgi:hypothetical protein
MFPSSISETACQRTHAPARARSQAGRHRGNGWMEGERSRVLRKHVSPALAARAWKHFRPCQRRVSIAS